MERQITLYPIIYCALLIFLVLLILVMASQSAAQAGPSIYDAIETLRFAV